jgi:hypothetical protein
MASSIIQSISAVTKDLTVIKFACTAAADGSFTAASTDTYIAKLIRGLMLYKFQVVIGANAPTASSDFTVKDTFGQDILGGQGADKITGSANATVENYPKINDQAANQPIVSGLTLAITNNSANAATFDIYLYFKKV